MAENQDNKIVLGKIIAIVLIILILIIWMFNLKNVWRANNSPAASNNSQWSDLRNNLETSLTSINNQLNRIQQADNNKNQAASHAFLSDLLNKVQSATSSPVAPAVVGTSTSPAISATSSPLNQASSSPAINKNSNCPKYIDCMPTIGSAKPCQIPVGCEGITQIAY